MGKFEVWKGRMIFPAYFTWWWYWIQISWLLLLLTWWRHQMETFPCYWPFVSGIHRSPGNSPAKPVVWIFDVSVDLCLNIRLGKQWSRRWFETPSRSLWRHCNVSTVGPHTVTGPFSVWARSDPMRATLHICVTYSGWCSAIDKKRALIHNMLSVVPRAEDDQ